MREHKVPTEVRDFLANQMSPSTVLTYRREIAAFLTHIGKPLEDVQCRDLIAYRRSLSGLKPGTVCRKLSTIRSLFRFLVEAGYRETNPAQVLKLPKNANTSPYRVLSVEELQKLVGQPDATTSVGVRDGAILLLLAVNGLRESELINIDREDVSRRHGFTVGIVRGKGSKVRIAKFVGTVESALWRWMEMTPRNAGPVFVAVSGNHITGQRLSTRSVRHRVALYARKAGILRRISPHALRHAAITHSLANGANILKVKEMAGHASLATTQRYLHDLEALEDNAVDYNPLTHG